MPYREENIPSRLEMTPRSILPLALAVFLGLFLFNTVIGLLTGLSSLMSDLLVGLLLSVVLYYLLEPPVTWLESLGINRGISSLLWLSLTCALFALVTVKLLPPLFSEIKHLQQIDVTRYMHQVMVLTERLQQYLDKLLPFSVKLPVADKLSSLISNLTSGILNFLTTTIPQTITLALTVPFFTFFFLKDADQFKKWLIGFVPNRYFETTLDMLYNITVQTGRFIRGKILESVIIAASTSIVLLFFSVRYNLLLSAFAGLSNLIPYVGPVIGAVPILIVGLTDLETFRQVIYLILAYFVFVQVIVDNMLVIPLLISRISDLHPFVVLIAVIAGGKFMGAIGMFISVPFVSVLKIIFEEIYYYLRYSGIKRKPITQNLKA